MKMQSIKVIKSKQVEATSKKPEKSKAGKVRASSCQRCPQREKGEGGTVVRGPARKPSCERRGRSSSTAPRTATKWPRTDPDYRRRGSSVDPKCRELIEQQGVRAESKHVSHSFSNKAFTVIPPNPNKRREIQRKAEAELAALEELRLSRAMAFVSISPSTVGGCMSLEEVRLKQQQEMMQAKRKHKPMMKQLMEQTTVLKS
ncbi:epithelial-stromal interaction protein 1 [Pseudochaenichthys georgianus]|uniref:epithelial-stromal interaction protein 1 n=1 Tax=Pseudochaenichthys georgianus TaxID=52239 RepID=UPI00146CF93F|nr:epithelial-stromal interaction protein 1 [Pseudochaenichthys georgianus]